MKFLPLILFLVFAFSIGFLFNLYTVSNRQLSEQQKINGELNTQIGDLQRRRSEVNIVDDQIIVLTKTKETSLPSISQIWNVSRNDNTRIVKTFGSGMWGNLFEYVDIKGIGYTFSIAPSGEVKDILLPSTVVPVNVVTASKRYESDVVKTKIETKIDGKEVRVFRYGSLENLKVGEKCGDVVLKEGEKCLYPLVSYINSKSQQVANGNFYCIGEDKDNVCDEIFKSISPVELLKP